MKPMKLVNGTGNSRQQHKTHATTLPATPWIYPSKRVQKCPNRPRIKGDTANFDEFCEISYNSFSFGPKIMFLDSFESSQVGISPYPAVPLPGFIGFMWVSCGFRVGFMGFMWVSCRLGFIGFMGFIGFIWVSCRE